METRNRCRRHGEQCGADHGAASRPKRSKRQCRGRARTQPTSATLTPEVLREIARVESEIDKIEEATLSRLAAPPDNQVQQVELLGKAMMYDEESLSKSQ